MSNISFLLWFKGGPETRSNLTMLDFALLVCHVLKVTYDGASSQVVEGLIPQLLVDLFLTLPSVQVGLDVKAHLPLCEFPAQQS